MLPKVSWKLSKKRLVYRKKELIFFCFGLLIIFAIFPLSKINKVECLEDNLPCSEALKSVSDKYLGKSYLSVSKKKIESDLNKIAENKTITVSVHLFQKIKIHLQSSQDFYSVNLSLIQSLPTLSFEASPTSTVSAQFFQKPSVEIAEWLKDQNFLSFNLYKNGSLTPTATASSNYHLFFQKKPTEDFLQKTYSLMKLLEMYTYDTENYYLIENTLYLQKNNSPDIIISSTASEESVLKALQHLGFITTIKKDPKIIDLRYKNPIIR